MNILIVDKSALSLAFALRCQSAGHRVKLFISPKAKDQRAGEGLVPRVRDWQPHMKWADLIFVSDNSYAIDELDRYMEKGFPVFGCNAEGAKWEMDRKRGQAIFNAAGLPEMVSHPFKKYDDAIRFIEKNPGRYVSKPNGDLDKKLSYVSKGPADMIYMLQKWKKDGQVQNEFILQEFHAGIEMAVGGWFGPDGWSRALCENWEFKKLCAGDVGPATGEMGTVLRYCEESKLADEVLFPLTSFLHAINYVGYCDVNCIIDDRGVPYPLEFTNRPGWPLFNIQCALHKGDPAEWMKDKLEGRDTLRVSNEIALGVVLALPDFPYSHSPAKELEGIPIYGDLRHVSLSAAMAGSAPFFEGGKIVEKEMPVSCGDFLLIATRTGSTVREAKERAYKTVKGLEIPNSVIYRTDIGHRLETQLDDLHKMGYADGMEWK